jgi:hypothetical protein
VPHLESFPLSPKTTPCHRAQSTFSGAEVEGWHLDPGGGVSVGDTSLGWTWRSLVSSQVGGDPPQGETTQQGHIFWGEYEQALWQGKKGTAPGTGERLREVVRGIFPRSSFPNPPPQAPWVDGCQEHSERPGKFEFQISNKWLCKCIPPIVRSTLTLFFSLFIWN